MVRVNKVLEKTSALIAFTREHSLFYLQNESTKWRSGSTFLYFTLYEHIIMHGVFNLKFLVNSMLSIFKCWNTIPIKPDTHAFFEDARNISILSTFIYNWCIVLNKILFSQLSLIYNRRFKMQVHADLQFLEKTHALNINDYICLYCLYAYSN